MEDLSLHILDITENSLRAGARNVLIKLIEEQNILTLVIEDDGKGMDDTTLKTAANPFYTTKRDKKYGLGLSLLSQASDEAGGHMNIEKRADTGIRIIATFDRNNIDMKPVGDIDMTLRVLKTAYPHVNISFEHISNSRGSA